MGDLINNHNIFKKLGFDAQNQWIFYDDEFHEFFSYFGENVTEGNLLTDKEVLEYNTMKELTDDERTQKLKELEQNYPLLLECKEEEISKLTNEIEALLKAEDMYAKLLEDMRNTKVKLNYQLSDLEENINDLLTCEKSTFAGCLEKSKELHEIQKENRCLYSEARVRFTKMHSPPLFIHQLPLDNYFLKCDSFLQYLNLYITENFKVEDYLDSRESDLGVETRAEDLEELRKLHLQYNELLIKEKAKSIGIQSMIDCLNVNQVHILNLSDMKKETRELEVVNHHQFNVTYETLINNLSLHLQQHTQQQMEMILYENTKQKLNRVRLRKEKVQQLTKIVSDALTNAELIWITIQLDLDRIRNRFDNTEILNIEAQRCMHRIDAMKNIQNSTPSNSALDYLLSKMAESLSQHLKVKVRNTPKACLYEYEKICRMLKYALQNVVNKKYYAPILKLLRDIDQVEGILKPLVYDSPMQAPKFEDVHISKSIYNARKLQTNIDNKIRSLRAEYQENISEKMAKNKFWCYSQLLWIWFLTEPRRLIVAIEEVKKAAANNPPMTGIKSFGGIKRK